MIQLLNSLTQRLKMRYSRTAEWEARMILRSVCGSDWQSRAVLGKSADAAEEARAGELVARRLGGEPLAYVLGDTAFGTLELKVGPGVLIPRVETELIVQAALEIVRGGLAGTPGLAGLERIDALDLGTGTGAIALALADADPRVHVDAVENSADALAYAAQNVLACPAGKRVRLIPMDYLKEDWADRLKSRYHLIMANPPYVSEADWAALPAEVKREPREALVGGPQGDEVLRWIIRHAARHLTPQGAMILEIGIGQAETLSRFAESSPERLCVRVLKDHQDIPRSLILRKN